MLYFLEFLCRRWIKYTSFFMFLRKKLDLKKCVALKIFKKLHILETQGNRICSTACLWAKSRSYTHVLYIWEVITLPINNTQFLYVPNNKHNKIIISPAVPWIETASIYEYNMFTAHKFTDSLVEIRTVMWNAVVLLLVRRVASNPKDIDFETMILFEYKITWIFAKSIWLYVLSVWNTQIFTE